MESRIVRVIVIHVLHNGNISIRCLTSNKMIILWISISSVIHKKVGSRLIKENLSGYLDSTCTLKITNELKEKLIDRMINNRDVCYSDDLKIAAIYERYLKV